VVDRSAGDEAQQAFALVLLQQVVEREGFAANRRIHQK